MRERVNEVSNLPTLESSPSLVLVFACSTVTPLVCQPTIASYLKRGVVRLLLAQSDISPDKPGSEHKRPVRPSLAMDGTDYGLGWTPGADGGCGVRPDGCPWRTVGDGRCLRWCNTLTEMSFPPKTEINLAHNTGLKERCLSAGEIGRHKGIPGGTEWLEFLYRSILNLLAWSSFK